MTLGFSPRVSLEPPDSVLVEVGGSQRLFGGLEGVRAGIEQAFAEQGWGMAQVALAPTPRAAVWLARGAPGSWIESPSRLAGALGALPLQALALDPGVAERLHGFGARRLRDVLRLPRKALARRTGVELNEILARALGERPDPRRDWRPPPRFSARREPGFETDSVELLSRVAGSLFIELAAVLRAGSYALRRCTLVLSHRDMPPTRIRIGTLAPVRDGARLQEQAIIRLAQTPLPAPVMTVTLHASRLESVAESAHDLFAPRASGEGWLALHERLNARLGTRAVVRAHTHADHRPEYAQHLQMACRSGVSRDSGLIHLPPRPLWLLDPPRPVSDITRYRVERGPERIESGWWDGDDVVRDYFVARDRDGSRCWLYRDRRLPHRWYLHGLFG